MDVKNVLSMEQMLHLKDLGYNIDDASMAWTRMVTDMGGNHIDRPWRLLRNEPIAISNMEDYERIPTFTLADIIEVLPIIVEGCYIQIGKRSISYSDYESTRTIVTKRKKYLIDACYEMLCWLIEKGHIETKKKEV